MEDTEPPSSRRFLQDCGILGLSRDFFKKKKKCCIVMFHQLPLASDGSEVYFLRLSTLCVDSNETRHGWLSHEPLVLLHLTDHPSMSGIITRVVIVCSSSNGVYSFQVTSLNLFRGSVENALPRREQSQLSEDCRARFHHQLFASRRESLTRCARLSRAALPCFESNYGIPCLNPSRTMAQGGRRQVTQSGQATRRTEDHAAGE